MEHRTKNNVLKKKVLSKCKLPKSDENVISLTLLEATILMFGMKREVTLIY